MKGWGNDRAFRAARWAPSCSFDKETGSRPKSNRSPKTKCPQLSTATQWCASFGVHRAALSVFLNGQILRSRYCRSRSLNKQNVPLGHGNCFTDLRGQVERNPMQATAVSSCLRWSRLLTALHVMKSKLLRVQHCGRSFAAACMILSRWSGSPWSRVKSISQLHDMVLAREKYGEKHENMR